MKYLILVHSNLIYGMARQVIQSEVWPEDAVVWVVDRQFPIEEKNSRKIDVSGLDITPFRWSERKEVFRKRSENKKSIEKIDQLLDGLNSEFIIVLPHTRNFKYHNFITHPACKGFYLLEEGKLSYTEGIQPPQTFLLRWKYRILDIFYRWFVQGRIPSFPLDFADQHPKYLGAFASSTFAFPSLKEKKIIAPPFVNNPALKQYQRVLVFGPYAEFRELPLKIQLDCLEALFQYFKREGIRQIHFKYHPRQLEQQYSFPEINRLIQKYSHDIQFDEIPPLVSLENIALSAQADFYLATSSTAIYAIAFDCRVFSYAHCMAKQHPEFLKVLYDIPERIRAKMIFLEL